MNRISIQLIKFMPISFDILDLFELVSCSSPILKCFEKRSSQQFVVRKFKFYSLCILFFLFFFWDTGTVSYRFEMINYCLHWLAHAAGFFSDFTMLLSAYQSGWQLDYWQTSMASNANVKSESLKIRKKEKFVLFLKY